MTAKQLIEELSKVPPTQEVKVGCDSWGADVSIDYVITRVGDYPVVIMLDMEGT